MKRLMVTSIVLLAGISGEVMAVDCSDGTQLKNTVSDPNVVANTLSGKTVCATNGGDKWQEFHQAGGALIDYKKGPNDLVDKTKQVGTWSTARGGSDSLVTYNYGTGGTYSYEVHLSGGIYTFCGVSPAPTLDVTLLSGQVSCGF
ncbi:MAG: hypothetical protein Q8O38_02000 [Sulfurimicrobium sp.]|nr:hypothetical protein [Sulfurimicrobium sp.]